ncbi:MAG: dethiobiotin synthetase [Saprospiraceae bacterium]|jgi:dethiobiotin synthetase
MNLIMAGIGTDVGKTVVSAIVCEALQSDYWKPVQAGALDNTDSHVVERLLSAGSTVVHPEVYRLSEPISPHAAAAIDDVEITLNKLTAPLSSRGHLVIELAGGLMVPLSEQLSTMDLVQYLNCPVILVANYYLGSINHTLLSLHLLRAQGVEVMGVIFNGEPNHQSRDIILKQGATPILADIPFADKLDATFIQAHAKKLLKHPAMARL